MIDPDSCDPEKSFALEEKGNPLPVEGGDLEVHEEVFHLLFSFHSKGLETVSGSEGTDGEGKVEGVKIQQGHVGGIFEEDLALPALNLETHGSADLGNFHIPWPGNGVFKGGCLLLRAGQIQDVVSPGHC
jgi:hypothetical protein